MPNCANLEMIDNLAQELVSNGFTGRGTSVKLIRALMAAPRTRGYILPFYARLVATLKPVMPDLGDKISNALTKELGYHIHKKDQIKVESKLKTVRFIGELVKFNIYGKPEALRFLSTLTRDFQHHSIEMLCALLETCGRQLMRWPDTGLKMKLIVDAITRKRASLVLDSRYQLVLDNALVCVQKQDDSTGSNFVREIGDPVQLFVIYILTKELTRQTANSVMRKLRMLDWDDPSIFDWLPVTIVSVVGSKLPYSRLPLLASLIAAFDDYGYGVIGVRVVDLLLEHIRLSLEYPNQATQQIRIAEARLLGECYNYRLCDSPVILRTLYLLITLGAGMPEFDSPDSLFRIRLACIILDICGPYFDRGAHKKKLDNYLLYLQLYFWQKKSNPFWEMNGIPFPVDTNFAFLDTMELLRPGVKPFKNLSDVEKAVYDKEQEMAAMVPKGGEIDVSMDDEDDEDDEGGDDEEAVDDDEDDVGEVEDDDESEEDDDDDDDGGETPTEFEDIEEKKDAPKKLECPEDSEFIAELEMAMAAAQSTAITQQSTMSGSSGDFRSNAFRIAQQKAVQQATQLKQRGEIDSSSESDAPDVVPFVLVSRKGNKPHMAPVTVPKSSPLVAGYLRHRETEEQEKAQLKKMILSHQYRQEREETQQYSDVPPSRQSSRQQTLANQQSAPQQQGGWTGRIPPNL